MSAFDPERSSGHQHMLGSPCPLLRNAATKQGASSSSNPSRA